MIFLLFLFAFIFGLSAEVWTHHFGWIIGLQYTFGLPGPMLFHVPLIICLMWMIGLPGFFVITNTLFPKLQKKKNFSILFTLSILDAYIAFLLYLLSDPIAVRIGLWTYEPRGPYFGIPFIEFMGVFFAIASFGLCARILFKKLNATRLHMWSLVASFAYTVTFIFSIFVALILKMYVVLFVDILVLGVSLYFYIRFTRK
ncbi:MAG TPA: carotenoid biosynthesis protein [Candidatus Eisenbacteria bacterium]|nr:carotenoid biosynthesis protein [Candidatus Eisenbacteria bacterium]